MEPSNSNFVIPTEVAKRPPHCHPDRGNEETEWRDLFGSQRSLGMTDWPARVAEVDNRGGRAFWRGDRSINPRGGESLHPGVLEFRSRFFGRSGLCDGIIGHESRCGIGDERRSEHIGFR